MIADLTIFLSNPSMLTLLLASAMTVVFSIWIFDHSVRGSTLPGCGEHSACDAATRSRWSRWGPFPVAAGGIILFPLMFCLTICVFWNAPSGFRTIAWTTLDSLAWIATGAAVWFIVLQAVVIRRFCLHCTFLHVSALVVAGILFTHTRQSSAPIVSVNHAVAAALLTGLIAGQIFLKPRTYAVALPSEISPAIPPSELQQSSLPPRLETFPRVLTGRRIRLHAGRVNLNLDDWPIIGPPQAQHVIAWLFDHTCKECHHEHRLMLEVVSRFNQKLAVIAVPVPMYASCNPTVKCKDEARAQACGYARLCWAVFLAAPDRYAEWDRFMAESEESQPFGIALQRAGSLADISRFAIRESDAELDRRVAAGVEIYRASEAGTIPAILLPRGILKGRVSTADELFSIIKKHL